MKSSISRSAASALHGAEEKPDEVLAALDDKTEALIPEVRIPAQALTLQ